MRALIVVPTYDEVGNVALVLRQLRLAVPEADILVVDDSSPDGTGQLVLTIGAELGRIDLLTRPGKLGLGSAYRDGLAWGLDRGYEVLVEMDADLSHDPAAVPSLLAALDDGADLAIGSRYIDGGNIVGWARHRRMLSRYGNSYSSAMLGLHVHDLTSGFRAFRAETLMRIVVASTQANGYGFQIEMVDRVARAGGIVVEVPITFAERQEGQSKMSTRIVVEALALVTWWRLRGRRTIPA